VIWAQQPKFDHECRDCTQFGLGREALPDTTIRPLLATAPPFNDFHVIGFKRHDWAHFVESAAFCQRFRMPFIEDTHV